MLVRDSRSDSQQNLFAELSNATKSGLQPAISPTSLINTNGYKSIDTALRSIFPSPSEENKLERARRTLGEIAAELPDDQLERTITEMQCLVNYWLDDYEKQVFDDLTLKQLLRES